MGFETAASSSVQSSRLFELCPYGIWNMSKGSNLGHLDLFELCPYGIWNKLENTNVPKMLNLNFVPMGFETVQYNLLSP